MYISVPLAFAGGMAALCIMLRAEAGNPHSKLASSCVALINMVLLGSRAAQDEIRHVGGIQVKLGHAKHRFVMQMQALMQMRAGI